MANGNPRSDPGTSSDAGNGPGTTPGVGKQGQGGESSRNDQGRSGSAQQEQGGTASQPGGMSGGDRDEERIDEDTNLQSGSSPRSRIDSPDEGKGG